MSKLSYILSKKRIIIVIISLLMIIVINYSLIDEESRACIESVNSGFLDIASQRFKRFTGKVHKTTALCRGGKKAIEYIHTPWVDWQNYNATGDDTSRNNQPASISLLTDHLDPDLRGIDGALLDLEYQRIELIKFNLFDQLTYKDYVDGRDGINGKVLKQWDEFRLSQDHIYFNEVGGNSNQVCSGSLITHRTLSGICNDLINPLMGSTGMPFSRNVQFSSTFPRLGLNEINSNRHAQRIDILKPDPQLISRKLFTRQQSSDNKCNKGRGLTDYSVDASCNYMKASHVNVLATFWIQFMTHDWFSHLSEGHNSAKMASTGCTSAKAIKYGCRVDDRREVSLYKYSDLPEELNSTPIRAKKVTANNVTAWWDASQIYGYDKISQMRVQRDPSDRAKLLLENDYLPVFEKCKSDSKDCPVPEVWKGQESVGFPDNWNIGLSFFHNLFAREHNYFVDNFRRLQKQSPTDDSGLRNPAHPDTIISYEDVDDERLYQVTRLVIAAEIAKIHTLEWTTQLLYNEPLFIGMNANWSGLFTQYDDRLSYILRRILSNDEGIVSKTFSVILSWFVNEDENNIDNSGYSILASGSGIFGLGNNKYSNNLFYKKDTWNLKNLVSDVNGGVNHFGSPFNFPEEFTSVYRLHALIPDLLEFREINRPDRTLLKIPVADTIRSSATAHMHNRGIVNWGISMGRQRAGALNLMNQPLFLQNLSMPHLNSKTKMLDVVALDIIRDRERGIPRYNEFRRQIGLKQLLSFDDFVNRKLIKDDPQRTHQEETVKLLRELYGTHKCDSAKIISNAQLNSKGNFIDDCLGQTNGSEVDNIEDLDSIVGWLAEYTRPHGFAISETQLQIFILNASRRLFSDRFLTSSFRPEFYSQSGIDWVNNNGPISECPYTLSQNNSGNISCLEPKLDNGHKIQVSPLKRLLLRNIPELKGELMPVKNIFDPWARDRGEYYSLEWTPRMGAESDPSFIH